MAHITSIAYNLLLRLARISRSVQMKIVLVSSLLSVNNSTLCTLEMSQYTATAILSLPNTFNGHILAISLLASIVLSIVTLIVGLIDPAVGYYTLFILLSIVPLTLIHHITIICLLHKHREEIISNSLVPRVLTRKTNVGFMLLFEATWASGTILGFTGSSSTDMATNMALVRASYAVGLAECIVLLVVIIACIQARRERSQVPLKLDSESA
ncbi:hypothetical protein AG1IA_05413 [Rhizoctonia solani AG-1 IA]|uniref:Uncharacterized protein n=1 Tax=Thanatephorus cucumeris (strain AG1-IA) TaxID=983506 RepID=L8WUT6_THACA|nr:hypothetical protein AG1IA_05413 [Rhizoctonia solani AG-1 IA]